MDRVRILIAEDDQNTLLGLLEILRQEGYEVTGVEKAGLALKALRQSHYDILLTDLRLPDMSGFDLYRESLNLTKTMKTIIMTAYSSQHDAIEAKNDGVFEYLTKPLDLDVLFEALANASAAVKIQMRLYGFARVQSTSKENAVVL